MPGLTGATVVTMLVCCYHHRTRGCGRNARPAFPAPSDLQKAGGSKQNSLRVRGENAEAWPLLFEKSNTKVRVTTNPRHHPPPGRRNAPPDNRLQRVIQYSRDSCN